MSLFVKLYLCEILRPSAHTFEFFSVHVPVERLSLITILTQYSNFNKIHVYLYQSSMQRALEKIQSWRIGHCYHDGIAFTR